MTPPRGWRLRSSRRAGAPRVVSPGVGLGLHPRVGRRAGRVAVRSRCGSTRPHRAGATPGCPAVLLVLGASSSRRSAANGWVACGRDWRHSPLAFWCCDALTCVVAVPAAVARGSPHPAHRHRRWTKPSTPILFIRPGHLQPRPMDRDATRDRRPRRDRSWSLLFVTAGLDPRHEDWTDVMFIAVPGSAAVRLRSHRAPPRRAGASAGRPAGGDPRPGGAGRTGPDRPRAARRHRPLDQRDGRADGGRQDLLRHPAGACQPAAGLGGRHRAGRPWPRPVGCCTWSATRPVSSG